MEEVVARHPAVREVAVFGVPENKRGETPVVAVILHERRAIGAEELSEWVNVRVAARYQRLNGALVMQGSPRSAAGKTLKREMRAPFWEGRERKI